MSTCRTLSPVFPDRTKPTSLLKVYSVKALYISATASESSPSQSPKSDINTAKSLLDMLDTLTRSLHWSFILVMYHKARTSIDTMSADTLLPPVLKELLSTLRGHLLLWEMIKACFAVSNPMKEKDQHFRGWAKSDKTSPTPDNEAPYIFYPHSFTSVFSDQKQQLFLSTQKETVIWWILESRKTASSCVTAHKSICLVILKLRGTEGFLHFLY